MNAFEERAVRRRDLLAVGVAALAVGPARAAGSVAPSASSAPPAPDAAGVIRRFVGLRARLDGRPVFAIARGTDAAIVDGASVPLRGQIIIQATRAIDLGGGAWELPYVEGTLTTEADTFRYLPELPNPLTGVKHAVAPPGVYLARLRMDAEGRLANHVEIPGGIVIDYSGQVAAQAGLEGRAWATQSLHIHIARPEVAPEDAFVTTTMLQTGEAHHGFLPADSTSTSLRPVLPIALGAGRAGSLVSTFFGRKYPTLDALRAGMDPDHRALFTPLFDQWQGLLP